MHVDSSSSSRFCFPCTLILKLRSFPSSFGPLLSFPSIAIAFLVALVGFSWLSLIEFCSHFISFHFIWFWLFSSSHIPTLFVFLSFVVVYFCVVYIRRRRSWAGVESLGRLVWLPFLFSYLTHIFCCVFSRCSSTLGITTTRPWSFYPSVFLLQKFSERERVRELSLCEDLHRFLNFWYCCCWFGFPKLFGLLRRRLLYRFSRGFVWFSAAAASIHHQ